MTQQADPTQQALSYMRHQAAKGLDSLAALLERTRADWDRCLEGMSDKQATFAPAGEWSAKEVLGHAVRACRGVNGQITEAVAGRGVGSPFGDAAALRNQPAVDEQRPVSDLRRDVAATFEETRLLATSLSGSPNLDATFQHPFFGQLNIREWIAFQRIHAMDHIQQIEKIKAGPAYPAP